MGLLIIISLVLGGAWVLAARRNHRSKQPIIVFPNWVIGLFLMGIILITAGYLVGSDWLGWFMGLAGTGFVIYGLSRPMSAAIAPIKFWPNVLKGVIYLGILPIALVIIALKFGGPLTFSFAAAFAAIIIFGLFYVIIRQRWSAVRINRLGTAIAPALATLTIALALLHSVHNPAEKRSMIWWEQTIKATNAKTTPPNPQPCEDLHLKFATERNGQFIGVPAAHCIRVHFATPRNPIGQQPSGSAMDAEQFLVDDFGKRLDRTSLGAAGLHLGYADVSLPIPVDYDRVTRITDPDGLYNRSTLDYLGDADRTNSAKSCTGTSNVAECEWLRLSRFAFITEITKHGSETIFTQSLAKSLQKTNLTYCRNHPTNENCHLNERKRQGALVFIHGFNQTFEDTIVRAAQLSLDLDLAPDGNFNITYGQNGVEKRIPVTPRFGYGAPILFTWPNSETALFRAPNAENDKAIAYRADRDLALASGPYLREFLSALTKNNDIDDINIIVHSMGHRIFINMIEEFVVEYLNTAPTGALKRIRVVHAAGDVSDISYNALMAKADIRFDDRDDRIRDAQKFAGADITQGEPNAFPQITVYKSNSDMALVASMLDKKLFHGHWRRRIGAVTPPKLPYLPVRGGTKASTHPAEPPNWSRDTGQGYRTPYLTTINVRGPSMDLLGHDYFSSDGNILNDIACFFSNDPREGPYGILNDRSLNDTAQTGTNRRLQDRGGADGGEYFDLWGGPDVARNSPCRTKVAPYTIADIGVMADALNYSYEDFSNQRTDYLIESTECVPKELVDAYISSKIYYYEEQEDQVDWARLKESTQWPANRGAPGRAGEEQEISELNQRDDIDIPSIPTTMNTSRRINCDEKSKILIDRYAQDDPPGLQGTPTEGRDTLIEGATIYFPLKSSILVCEAREQLRLVADFIAENAVASVRIEGHANMVGKEGLPNTELSYQRAERVRRHLISVLDIPSDLIIPIATAEETTPAKSSTDEGFEQRNRRVEITIQYYPDTDESIRPSLRSVWADLESSTCPDSLTLKIQHKVAR